ncbi:hypothetical protein [Bacillus sp. REN16]|uniref:hypothetical protein n=1 Tax=Bacillus sp. REN16 TaxID=2887296 RepID=UPI001E454677|nr:hypothetical protein [Bacillus sp. REN16]MCC3357931.1 hypothetical protein [Bacillus sp. REN16]
MQLFATFDSHGYLEIAIAAIEKKGIKSENIFAVPLDNRTEDLKLFDTLHRSDGTTLIDIGVALATAFSVIGASVGFKLTWGPIYWGLIGAAIGFIVGLLIRLFVETVYKKKKRLKKGKIAEIILIIDCEETEAKQVESILWEHFAMGVALIQ